MSQLVERRADKKSCTRDMTLCVLFFHIFFTFFFEASISYFHQERPYKPKRF